MFKQKYKILCIVIVVSFVIVNFIFAKPKEKEETTTVFYNSPEEAIEMQLKTTDYVMVESNGVVLSVCDTTVNNYTYQFAVKTDNGWGVVSDYVIKNSILSKYEKSGLYSINVYKYMDKYFICIRQDELSIDKHGLLNVTDSVGSQFEETEFETEILRYYYWFLCLDTLPDDYFVKINDETINIIKYTGGKIL